MTTTKIKIDLQNGIIEAEGTESFVLGIYSDYKEQMDAAKTSPIQTTPRTPAPKKKKTKSNKSPAKKTGKKKTASDSTGKLVKDLDLSGTGGKQSLREYYGQYKAKTNLERNLVFSYYLEHEIGMESIGIDEIFTCYRNIQNLKVPGNLKQSLYDTSAKGWLKITSIEDGISVPVSGLNHIEHDLERNE
ncbi:MAG: hypothetical protein AB2727_03950 [Candidatus Thiodiazotropha taylori]